MASYPSLDEAAAAAMYLAQRQEKAREREWMENFVTTGFIDSFRYFNEDPHHYTWWSFRAGARKKNLGWRIDYNMVTKELEPHLKRSAILCDAVHSDHCPVLLELSI